MKPNEYKSILPQIMPNKRLRSTGLGLCLSLFWAVAVGDEILGHISDDTEPQAAQHSQADAHPDSDRKIIYRVICSPADEPLPDCEQPVHDVESDNQPQVAEEVTAQPQDAEAGPVEPAADDEAKKPVAAVKPAAKATQTSKAAAKKQPETKKSKPVAKSSSKTKVAAKKTAAKPIAKKSSAKKK